MQKDLVITGQEHIPASGPVLFLANHPGMTDTVSLFASIPRPDLRIVAADRPFLRALAATDPLLFYVSEENNARLNVVRQVAVHLRAGGAVLTFPAGHIEPDPLVLPGAEASLADWSSSIGVFARLAPETQIIPVIASGVLAPKATHHPLTRLRRRPKDRERLGATIQILAGVLWPSWWTDLWQVTVNVQFAPPIAAADLVHLHDPEKITAAVLERIRPFIRQIAAKKFPA
jgi:putative hemolysin